MKGINNQIIMDNEEAYTIVIEMENGKTAQRCAGIRKYGRDAYCGYLTKNKKLMGRWLWNMKSYNQPVFFSALKSDSWGRPLHTTRGPLIEALRNLVYDYREDKRLERKGLRRAA